MAIEQQIELVNNLLQLKRTTTKADKQNIIAEHKDNPLFVDALNFLLNPYITVGLSTKKITKNIDEAPAQIITDFDLLLDYLKEHHTGNNHDIAVVQSFLNQFDADDKSIFATLITKTLTLGVSAKTVNKALDMELIPTFDVQLAFPYAKKIDKYDANDKFYVTQKLDGHRALTMVSLENGQIKVTVFTRTGQQIDGLNELHNDILNFIGDNRHILYDFPHGIAIDGELLLQNPNQLSTADLFQATSTVLRSDGEKKNITYNVFDVLPLNEFLKQDASQHSYDYRRHQWLDQMTDSQLVHVIPVLAEITKDDIPEWSNYATNNGWEGVMLNYANGLYQKKRSAELLKVKRMHTADLEIIGFNEAISGKFKGQLKSINVRLDDDNIVQVGSGVTEQVRDEIWKDKEAYIGVMAEIQYFEVTTTETGRSLRFPVFKAFRFDKTPEDTNIE